MNVVCCCLKPHQFIIKCSCRRKINEAGPVKNRSGRLLQLGIAVTFSNGHWGLILSLSNGYLQTAAVWCPNIKCCYVFIPSVTLLLVKWLTIQRRHSLSSHSHPIHQRRRLRRIFSTPFSRFLRMVMEKDICGSEEIFRHHSARKAPGINQQNLLLMLRGTRWGWCCPALRPKKRAGRQQSRHIKDD